MPTRTRRRPILALPLALALLVAPASARAVAPGPPPAHRAEILVLHSYAPEYEWTRNEQRGIEAVLGARADAIDVSVEYLDSMRNPAMLRSPLLVQLLREKYAWAHLDAIVVSDNAAFDFVRAHRDELFPRVPVVFLGVNGFRDEMLGGLDGFTGVAEDPDFLAAVQLAATLRPATRRVVLPGSPDDPTYRGNVALVRERALPKLPPDLEVSFPACQSLDACLEILKGLPRDSAVLVVGNYRDAFGRAVNNQRAVEILSAALDVPIFTAWEFAVGHGAVGGRVISGADQGRAAAEIVLRILAGERPSDIPVRRNVGNAYAFDVTQLSRFAVSRRRLPPDAELVNAPPRVYQVSRPAIWGGLAALLGLAAVAVALALNIGRRRRAERRLASTNRQLLDIIEFLPDATAVIDGKKCVIAWNRAMEQLTGVPKEEMLGREHFQFSVPFYGSPRPFLMDLLEKDDAQLASAYASVERHGDNLFAESFAPALYDGRGAHVWATATALRDPGGKPVGAIESIRDITEQRRAAEAMREANERFGAVFRATAYSIVGTDRAGTITMFNEGAERMLGYRSEEVVGKLRLDALHAPDELATRAAELGVEPGLGLLVRTAASGEPETRECTYVRKDGSRLPVALTVTEMRAEGGARMGYIAIARDVTAERKLEQQLLQSQKMESIGQLAGGIAHDLNNLLMPITGFSELFLLDLPPGDPRHEGLREIHEAAKRAADLTRQLLAFSRKQVLELKTVRLEEVVRVFGRMLRRTLGEDIRIEVAAEPGLAAVRADAGQIEQVLMNLSLNARDAMPGGGVLSIALANARIDEEDAARAAEVKRGAYVVMQVSDTGVGMAPEVASHVFEPFFSTKEAGKGTGLGLSMVYGIIKQHGGNVTVSSEQGKGTTFRIYLPRAPDDAAAESARAPLLEPRELARGRETILVVEDNDIVRDVACSMLRRLGYDVLDADGGEAALRVAFAHTARIDLLLTDVVMPRMNGKEIHTRLDAALGGLKVLYMSGYAASVIVNRGALDPGVSFIQKPLSLEALAWKIREVLES